MCSCSVTNESVCDRQAVITKGCDSVVMKNTQHEIKYLQTFLFHNTTISSKLDDLIRIDCGHIPLNRPPAVVLSDETVRRMEQEIPDDDKASEEARTATQSQCHNRTCLCCDCQEKYGSLNTAEEARTTSQCHNRTCLCCDCQEKYGSLPLFAQVIDSRTNAPFTGMPGEVQDEAQAGPSSASTSTQPSTSHTSPTKSPSSTSRHKHFQCATCRKQFTHRGDYHKHVRVHSGDKPYACALCPLRFAHPSNRTRHLRSHSTERPYTCAVCDRKFYRKDKLDRHRMSNKCRKRSKREEGEG